MNAVLGTINPAPSRVVSAAHPPILVSKLVLEDAGVIADGQIVALDSDSLLIAHQEVADVDMTGMIDGTNKDFAATLDPAPVLPGSVQIDNNNTAPQVIVDDGHGRLVGGGSGTVNYKTGEVAVTFTTAPAAGKTVKIGHKTQPVGASVNACDTGADDTALVIRHGAVNRDLILTGSLAADAEDIAALEAIGIFAV